MKEYYTLTENGAIQWGTTGDRNLDLFAKIGSMRNNDKDDILRMFRQAFVENPVMAVSILFWVRAVRDGSGERKIFETIVKDLVSEYPEFISSNLSNITEVGSYKDLAKIYDLTDNESVKDAIVNEFLSSIVKGNQLAMKWLPRKTELWSKVRKASGMSNADFRHLVNSHTVETKICKKEFDKIDYKKIPSLALKKYSKFFIKKDNEKFMKTVEEGKVHSKVLYPYQITEEMRKQFFNTWSYNIIDSKLENSDMLKVLEAQWNNLPDCKLTDTVIVMDASGSMCSPVAGTVQALDIAGALALYASNKTTGYWKDRVIAFSGASKIVDFGNINGLLQKYTYMLQNCSECMNTNLRKVFQLILKDAITKKITKDNLVKKVIIISDMQFDRGVTTDRTLMQEMADMYKYHGYELPKVVYWNVSARLTGVPVTKNDYATLISGFSSNMFKAIANDETIDPIAFMTKAVEKFTKMINFRYLSKNFSPYVKKIVDEIKNPHETRVEIDTTPAYARLDD